MFKSFRGYIQADAHAVYDALFHHYASHGFIVAAANTGWPGDGSEMIACLDWILTANVTTDSNYEDMIDVDHIASSGFSQGGCGCLMAGRDPRFVATLPISPYLGSLGGCDSDSAINDQLHPMFLLSGGNDTTADPDIHQEPIFNGAEVPIVWGTLAGAGHNEVETGDYGGGYRGPMTAWLRYMLMDDQSAGDWFRTDPCTLCDEPSWTVVHNTYWTD